MDFPLVKAVLVEPFADCLAQIWQAVKQAEVLRECDGCSKMGICHPCAAMLQAETGNVNQKAPYLCQIADAILEKVKACKKETI